MAGASALKEFGPFVMHDNIVISEVHFLLPDLLLVQNDLDVACSLLKGPLASIPSCPEEDRRDSLRMEALSHLEPVVGVKIGNPKWHKAWVRHLRCSPQTLQLTYVQVSGLLF